MITDGRDSALLRLTLARLLRQQKQIDSALVHLESAVAQDPEYTAAWKELGHARLAAGRDEDARSAWRRGVEVARAHGDKQAEKEMGVFLRRLDKSAGPD